MKELYSEVNKNWNSLQKQDIHWVEQRSFCLVVEVLESFIMVYLKLYMSKTSFQGS
jgi:hypothetical protein